MTMSMHIPHSLQRLTLALAVAFGLAACETAPKPVEPSQHRPSCRRLSSPSSPWTRW